MPGSQVGRVNFGWSESMYEQKILLL
jgi:hypothetical protein